MMGMMTLVRVLPPAEYDEMALLDALYTETQTSPGEGIVEAPKAMPGHKHD